MTTDLEPPVEPVRPVLRSGWQQTLRFSMAVLRRRFREERLGVIAGSLTFTSVISLVPLLTVALALFSAFPMFSRFETQLQAYLVQNLIPDSIARPVMLTLTQFSSKAHRLGTVGLVVLGLTALSLMLTIDRTLNAIWHVRKPRPLGQKVLIYWATLTLGPLLLALSLSLTSYALTASRGLVHAPTWGVRLFMELAEFSLFALGVAALFRFVPNTHVRARHALAGGVLVSLGFELAKRLMGWYLGEVTTYATIYGAFAMVPIFLIWLYLSWSIVLGGAVLVSSAPSLDGTAPRFDPDRPGERFRLALALLRELAEVRLHKDCGLTLGVLSARVGMDRLGTEPVLDLLIELDWVARLDEAGEPRHVLLADPSTTRIEPLIGGLLIDAAAPELEPLNRHAGLAALTLAQCLPASIQADPG
jgi:membrane protein